MFEESASADDADLHCTSVLALGWLARDELPRVLVGDGLTLLWANDAARRFLADEVDLEIRDNLLSTYNRGLQPHLAAFVADCSPDLQTLCLPREQGCGHILFRARQVAVRDGRRFVGISFHRSGSDFVERYADLKTAFQLTAAEHRVLERMLEGATADEISSAVGLSIETIRTHIRNIYTKVGVASRERLFARLRPYRI